ncbi:MAG: putative SOS response-associated peptidase YedK [Anaerolineales bacterium]|nr:putative SOS response-associated peptidase YedK [Anaerolineales bacterium]
MCGRFTLVTSIEDIAAQFSVTNISVEHQPRYNIAPTQEVLVLVKNGDRRLDQFRWGLVPHWSKGPNTRYSMINARAETVAEKPSYRTPFAKRRCLVLADGFYEWQKRGDEKAPMYIRLESGRPFGLAGLWDLWTPPEGGEPLKSCTIVTTTPNELLKPIHNRMPVILPDGAIEAWLDIDGANKDELLSLLGPYPDAELEAYAVSRYVNSPANDSPKCIQPV